MKPDIEKYRAFVGGFDLSDTQQIELIHMIWRLMENLADQTFGLDPVGLARSDNVASNKPEPLGLSRHYAEHACGAMKSTQTTTDMKD